MAFENLSHGGPVGLSAAADLSAKQHLFVKVTAANKVNVCGDGELAVGVLLNKPSADGIAASICGIGDCVKVIGAEAISAGAKIASDANGKAVAAAATDFRLGIALDATTADGEYVTVYFFPAAVANV